MPWHDANMQESFYVVEQHDLTYNLHLMHLMEMHVYATNRIVMVFWAKQ